VKSIFLILVACLLALPVSGEARDWRPVFRAAADQDGRRQADDSRKYRRPSDDRSGGRSDRRNGRLTDEERRELHRDLDRANRELYRRKPGR
jgi:hypothetical protein